MERPLTTCTGLLGVIRSDDAICVLRLRETARSVFVVAFVGTLPG